MTNPDDIADALRAAREAKYERLTYTLADKITEAGIDLPELGDE